MSFFSELKRRNVFRIGLAETYRFIGLYTLAENQYKKVIELNPDFTSRYGGLANLYRHDTGQLDKALARGEGLLLIS